VIGIDGEVLVAAIKAASWLTGVVAVADVVVVAAAVSGVEATALTGIWWNGKAHGCVG
jgi:hypothetical protein